MADTSKTLFERIAEDTANNAHTEARIKIAEWVAGGGPYELRAAGRKAYDILKAVALVADELGQMSGDLLFVRERATAELFNAMRQSAPELEAAFRKCL